jgi:hypothetical protein
MLVYARSSAFCDDQGIDLGKRVEYIEVFTVLVAPSCLNGPLVGAIFREYDLFVYVFRAIQKQTVLLYGIANIRVIVTIIVTIFVAFALLRVVTPLKVAFEVVVRRFDTVALLRVVTPLKVAFEVVVRRFDTVALLRVVTPLKVASEVVVR